MKTFVRFPRRSSGFTLLELLIVIAIIAILASVAFPVTALVIKQARKAEARNEVVNIVRAVKAYDFEYSKMPIARPSPRRLPTRQCRSPTRSPTNWSTTWPNAKTACRARVWHRA